MIFKIFIDKKTEIDEKIFCFADKFNDLRDVIKLVDCFFFFEIKFVRFTIFWAFWFFSIFVFDWFLLKLFFVFITLFS